MDSHKPILIATILAAGQLVLAQLPTYGVGRTPTADEVKAWDISIGPSGKELPQGHGTAKDGARLFLLKGCGGCHGRRGLEAERPLW
jgi:hypothetical protein